MSKKQYDLKGVLAKAKPEARPALITKAIDRFIREILDMRQEDPMDYDQQFFDLGLDSITAVKLKEMIIHSLDGSIELETTEIFDYPTVGKLSDYLYEKLSENNPSESVTESGNEDDLLKRMQEKLDKEG